MLESANGYESLKAVGESVWKIMRERKKRECAGYETMNSKHGSTNKLMGSVVTQFLARCRANPPNILLSDHIRSDGINTRVAWTRLQGNKLSAYNAKIAVIYRLNSRVGTSFHSYDTRICLMFISSLFKMRSMQQDMDTLMFSRNFFLFSAFLLLMSLGRSFFWTFNPSLGRHWSSFTICPSWHPPCKVCDGE